MVSRVIHSMARASQSHGYTLRHTELGSNSLQASAEHRAQLSPTNSSPPTRRGTLRDSRRNGASLSDGVVVTDRPIPYSDPRDPKANHVYGGITAGWNTAMLHACAIPIERPLSAPIGEIPLSWHVERSSLSRPLPTQASQPLPTCLLILKEWQPMSLFT